MTYNTHVVTISVLPLKKKGQCRPWKKWTSLCKFLHFQLHLLSELYLHCIRQRDCTVSCYLTAGHVFVVLCGCHFFNTGQYIEKFIIQFAVTRKSLQILSWSKWLSPSFFKELRIPQSFYLERKNLPVFPVAVGEERFIPTVPRTLAREELRVFSLQQEL